MVKHWSKYIAESIGTGGILFFGCGAAMLGLPETPLVFGIAVACMIYTLGHISGAHFNPAVTLAFAVARHFPARHILPYMLAQCGGAIVAIFLLSCLIPDAATFGETAPSHTTSLAFGWEVVLSFFLMFVITAVATDTRAEGIMAGIAIGSMVALSAWVGGPFSGASMNPARSLAPALFSDRTDGLWIYLSAPFLGAALGALAYQLIRCSPEKTNVKGCC